MKKIILLAVVIILSVFIFLKIKKTYDMDLKNPKLESKESILKFIENNKIYDNITLIPKSENSYDQFINPLFNMGSLWVFDNTGKLINFNIENEGGDCFEDIKNNVLKNDFNYSSSLSQKIIENDYLEELMLNTECIKGCDYNFQDYKYIIVYGWSIYYGMSYKNSQIKEIIDHKSTTKEKILIIGVNNDFTDTWYPKNKELPVIR